MESPQPILEYASAESPDGGIVWREDGPGGYEFIVPPPPLARLLIGPIITIVLLSPFLTVAITALAIHISEESRKRPFPVFSAMFVLLFGLAMFRAIRRLVTVARYGRCSFVLRISTDGFTVAGAFAPHADAIEKRPVVKVYFEEANHLFHRVAFLCIYVEDKRAGNHPPSYFRRDELVPVSYYIPWPKLPSVLRWKPILRQALIATNAAR